MALTFTPLHPLFVAEVGPVSLRETLDDRTLAEIRGGMDRYAVLVFRNQQFTDEEEMAFARRLDGELHAKTGAAALGKTRLGTEAIADISNVRDDGAILEADNRKRLYGLGNRLWHTDASFQDPAGRYSMLHARILPPVGADTLFADQRAAYDALDDEMKARLEGLTCHHSIAHSRQTLGFEFSAEEMETLKGAYHPLVRTLPRAGRKTLYLASHAARILEMSLPEGRLLLWELMQHAVQPQFVYAHRWQDGDLVIWDNRCTLHRATPFDDAKYRRELRRVTTLDLAELPAA
ncbi:MAG: TauD/TfdA family dioxygenase [Alphaproteobacteria bacterium]|nr:TauD/TfdA family dioxygenase [Alphaproteobacteria bacterium]